MNISTPETDNAQIHLQTMLLRVRKVLNECSVDPRLTLLSLRGWLDVCIRYEEEMEAQRALLAKEGASPEQVKRIRNTEIRCTKRGADPSNFRAIILNMENTG
jgi:hypothetical protein